MQREAKLLVRAGWVCVTGATTRTECGHGCVATLAARPALTYRSGNGATPAPIRHAVPEDRNAGRAYASA